MLNPAVMDAAIDGPGGDSYPERPTQEFVRYEGSALWHMSSAVTAGRVRCYKGHQDINVTQVMKAFEFPEPACQSCVPRFHVYIPDET